MDDPSMSTTTTTAPTTHVEPHKRPAALSRRVEITLNIFLAILGPLLIIGTLEGIAYFWERNQAEGQYAWELVASRRVNWIPYEKPGAGYTLMKPESHYEWQGIPVNINMHGLRSPETTFKKPAGTFRILNLGDSVVMGWGVKQEETYGMRLDTVLNASSGGERRYEVINAGVPGWNLDNELAYLEAQGSLYEPDLVLLDITVVNDIFGKNALEQHNQSEVIEWLRSNTYSWPFLSIQMQWIKARSEGNDRISAIDPPVNAASYFPTNAQDERWERVWQAILGIQRKAQESGAQFAIVLFPLEYQVLDEDFSTVAQTVLTEKAEEAGIPVIDLLPAYREACREKSGGPCQLEDRYLFADVWMHPSALGHRITANVIVEFMQGMMFNAQ